MRIALITNIPSPYRLPVWDALARSVDSLRVFLCADTEPNRIWPSEPLDRFPFTYRQLPGMHLFIRSMDWGIHFNPSLWRELDGYEPTHILLGSYETPSYLLALYYAKSKHIPVTLWWESHAFSSRVRNGPVTSLKRRLLRQVDSFCAVSSLSGEYLTERMGIPAKKIVQTVNTVDVCRWHALAMQHRQAATCADRPLRFLYVGQFIERKGIFELLAAFKNVLAEHGVLRLVGYGPLETQIRDFLAEHRLENVELAGASTSIEQTARQYAWADVLVMPSLSEVWGLVANEALASGVYVMASRYAGATRDLIDQAPCNAGMSFDPLEKASFVSALFSVIEKRKSIDPQAISCWGLQHTPERYAQHLREAVSLAAG